MNNFTTARIRNLQRGVRFALGFGIVTSVTANVIHSLTRPHDQDWQTFSSATLSALAPVVLFISMEMVVRIPIHSRVLGVVRLIITLALAGFSGWVSYWHMVSVAGMLGEDGGAQYIYPLLIDGMMVVATISLIEVSRLGLTVETGEAEVAAAAQAAAAAAAAQAAKSAARRCQPGCTCGRHGRKAAKTTKRVRRVPAAAPMSPGMPPVQQMPVAV